MEGTSFDGNELQRELAYYKKQLDKFSGESIKHDFVLSSLRRELKQKKAGFSILSTLQSEFSVTTPLDLIFATTVKAINTQLNMDRSVILVPISPPNKFKASKWYGYQQDQLSELQCAEIEIQSHFLATGKYIMHNKSMQVNDISQTIQN